MQSSQLTKAFQSYSDFHKTPGNKLTHYFGIPMIVFSTFGLLALAAVPAPLFLELNVATLVWLASAVYYFTLDGARSVFFSIISFIFYYCALYVTWPVHLFLFICGWILQGVGHYHYEKKSPAFLTNISHLLIGPYWIYKNLINKLVSK